MEHGRKAAVLSLIIAVSASLLLSGCFHTHEWAEATCTEPRRWTGCEETEGEPLGHDWQDATCTKPRTCKRCGETEGEPLGHDWLDATCTEPRTCKRCGETRGEPLGHDVPELSCTEGGICLRCGEELEPLGHDWLDATCTEPQTCARCGETEGKPLGHSPADPVDEDVVDALCTEDGSYREAVYCSVCGEELSSEDKTLKALGHTTRNGFCERCGEEIHDKISGEGNAFHEDIAVGGGLFRVRFTNEGRGPFNVWVKYGDGTRLQAVESWGTYDGAYFLYSTGPYSFEIESSGKWTYRITRLENTDETSFKGTGSAVTDIFTAPSGEWRFRHTSNGDFKVWIYTNKGRELLVNERGACDLLVPVSIPSGSTCVLVLRVDGSWIVETG